MNKLLIFAGTTEGRELAEYLERQNVSCDICVATEYGELLLEESTLGHRIHRGRLDETQMAALIQKEEITVVVDATHPYAVLVSEHIKEACEKTNCRYLRLLRETGGSVGEGTGECSTGIIEGNTAGSTTGVIEGNTAGADCVYVDSVEAAVTFLKGTSGTILAATGSKELKKYTELENYQERVVARVLSTPEAVCTCADLGFQGKNLICMQGPFDEELNYAMLLQVKAAWLVTKESGKTGGFPEKMRAAKRAGARLVIVGRPQQETGYTAAQIRGLLCELLQIAVKRQISVVGIGMGNPDNMTLEARKVCEEADVLIGAGRMLATMELMNKPTHEGYRPEEIKCFLAEHPEYEKAVLLLSGDVGFYSGARQIFEYFGEETKVYSGISSVVYLCGKLHTAWDDVKLISIHGRDQNLISAVRTHKKVFALVGKQENFRAMCRKLIEYGMNTVMIYAGCDLSYQEERILQGSPEEMLEQEVGDLTAVLIEQTQAFPAWTGSIPDSCFERIDKIPMTKEEVRCISIGKLGLGQDSIIYDIGAGSGSVAVEMALKAAEGQVYAIEKKPEAVELIRQNQRKFKASNITIVSGLAPEALETLPIPTHAFIGGSSGNLKQIMELLLEKNPKVRMVINAIALETVNEVMAAVKSLPVTETDIACITVSKAKEAGPYHLMMGQNPVYVISCTGNGGAVS